MSKVPKLGQNSQKSQEGKAETDVNPEQTDQPKQKEGKIEAWSPNINGTHGRKSEEVGQKNRGC